MMKRSELTTATICNRHRKALKAEREALNREEEELTAAMAVAETRLPKIASRRRQLIEEFHQLEWAEDIYAKSLPRDRLARVKRAIVQCQSSESDTHDDEYLAQLNEERRELEKQLSAAG